MENTREFWCPMKYVLLGYCVFGKTKTSPKDRFCKMELVSILFALYSCIGRQWFKLFVYICKVLES